MSLHSNSADAAFDPVLGFLPFPALICSADLTILMAGDNACSLFARARRDLVGQKLSALLSDCPSGTGQGTIMLPDGSARRVTCSRTDWHDRVLVQLADNEEAHAEIDRLAYSESIWRIAVEASGQGVWDYNAIDDSRFYCKGWKRLRGFDENAIVIDTLESWEARVHPDDLEAVREHVRQHNEGEIGEFAFEYREQRLDGRWIWILSRGKAVDWDKNGKPTRLTGIDIDITSLKDRETELARQRAEAHDKQIRAIEREHLRTEAAREDAQKLADHDPLTGLMNRRAFFGKISELIWAGRPFSILLIDLDRFKPVNDIHGHPAGDAVLCEVARRLKAIAGSHGIAARIGGDEFGVILFAGRSSDLPDPQAVGDRIINAFCNAVDFGSGVAEIGASVGIAVYARDGEDAKSLFAAADIALYTAKNAGRGCWRSYDRTMSRAYVERLKFEEAVRSAVRRDLFEPYFQPIVDLSTGRISSLEVLARWTDPDLGLIPPDRFLPVIENTGQMVAFSRSLLKKACTQAASWKVPVRISVNVGATEMSDPKTARCMLAHVADTGFPPEHLAIEVTEKALVNDVETARAVMDAFRAAGVRIVLDDFGAGYSGLGYLRDFRFDELKIDRSFISTMRDNSESRDIVGFILALSSKLGMDVICEGIEDDDTLESLRSLGVRYGQGYHFAPPMPGFAVPALLSLASLRKPSTGTETPASAASPRAVGA